MYRKTAAALVAFILGLCQPVLAGELPAAKPEAAGMSRVADASDEGPKPAKLDDLKCPDSATGVLS